MCHAVARHARGKRRLVEIGCWHGVNTRRIRSVMADNGLLLAVDPYPRGRLGVSFPSIIARREGGRVRRGELRWLRMTDVQAAEWAEREGVGPFDFVFSDAVNSFEGMRATWESWSRRVSPGGIYIVSTVRSIPGYNIDDVGSAIFFREVIAQDPLYEVLETVDLLAVLRRKE
jgi:predicted O-methyltransferase YrrM